MDFFHDEKCSRDPIHKCDQVRLGLKFCIVCNQVAPLHLRTAMCRSTLWFFRQSSLTPRNTLHRHLYNTKFFLLQMCLSCERKTKIFAGDGEYDNASCFLTIETSKKMYRLTDMDSDSDEEYNSLPVWLKKKNSIPQNEWVGGLNERTS